jgi:hypothetical protein
MGQQALMFPSIFHRFFGDDHQKLSYFCLIQALKKEVEAWASTFGYPGF